MYGQKRNFTLNILIGLLEKVITKLIHIYCYDEEYCAKCGKLVEKLPCFSNAGNWGNYSEPRYDVGCGKYFYLVTTYDQGWHKTSVEKEGKTKLDNGYYCEDCFRKDNGETY